jgi:hypothetical protein
MDLLRITVLLQTGLTQNGLAQKGLAQNGFAPKGFTQNYFVHKSEYFSSNFNEERSAAVSNVLRRLAQGMASLEKAANAKYEANTPKRWHVKKFIAGLLGGAQNGQW